MNRLKKIFQVIIKKWKIVLIILLIIMLGYGGVIYYYSKRTNTFDMKSSVDIKKDSKVKGVIFVKTLCALMRNELNSRSGWTPNDVFPSPTYFIDNLPNEQLGILNIVQRTTYQLNENMSRLRSTDRIIPEIEQARIDFLYDPNRWVLPASENKYKKGILSLEKYIKKLESGEEIFSIRSDSLINLIDEYRSIIGSVTTRLRTAVSSKKMIKKHTDKYNKNNKKLNINYKRNEIDDVFYYSRGVGESIYFLLQAIRIDYANVLKDKNSESLFDEILYLLEDVNFDPYIVCNGSRDSIIIPNHLANLCVILQDLRMKLSSLRTMLDQG